MHRVFVTGARRLFVGAVLGVSAALLASCASTSPSVSPYAVPAVEPELAEQVEIRRTTYGVPQILAENLRAAAFALGYVQMEDYGERVVDGLQAARGRMALVEGRRRVDADARNRLRHRVALESFERLAPDTREVYEGFAAGVNHYIRRHPDRLPGWVRPDFTAVDVLARDITWPAERPMNVFRRRLEANSGDPLLLVETGGEWRRLGAATAGAEAESAERLAGEAPARVSATGPAVASWSVPTGEWVGVAGQDDENVGSNAWALAPERTAGGGAIMMRNPHLSWSAGYYEAHLRVPGELDFYGDFRVGGPFTVIGGFNPRLAFSTTNNESRSHEFYAFRLDPERPDHFVLDGVPYPIDVERVEVEYVGGEYVEGEFVAAGETRTATREFQTTEFGPVVHRTDSLVYIHRSVNFGDHRPGEQWLRMMKATTLDEWLDAMRMGARMTSNFTYADADGNIFYVSVQGAPMLPHPVGGDTLAILATRAEHVWSEAVPFDSLPQLLNPRGGYVRNENDSPHYTNMYEIMDHDFSFWVQEPRLRMRSQHGIELLHNDRIFTLEDAVEAKHSMRILLADRVKDDLIAAVRATHAGNESITDQAATDRTASSAGRAAGPERTAGAGPTADEIARAIELLEGWDNTVAAESRGAVLFQMWWDEYLRLLEDGDDEGDAEPFAFPWTPDAPMETPRGLADLDAAAAAFPIAVEETARRFGSWDVAWGEVHRVRRGSVDVPVGGCGGALGCFRVLNFETDEDGRRAVNGGDGWVIAVQFGERPRAYSVLGYGQTNDPDSPYHDNQAELFASNQMKPVLWTEAEIESAIRERYRPGQEARR